VAPLARTGAHSMTSAVVGGVVTYLGIVTVLLARRRRLAWMRT
jgi:LPXTG-motif cell wall-anchored protein